MDSNSLKIALPIAAQVKSLLRKQKKGTELTKDDYLHLLNSMTKTAGMDVDLSNPDSFKSSISSFATSKGINETQSADLITLAQRLAVDSESLGDALSTATTELSAMGIDNVSEYAAAVDLLFGDQLSDLHAPTIKLHHKERSKNKRTPDNV